ncbi:hypothetical protein [Synechococcus elongatus]|uniref:PD(D/E)XK endonuclease domain-containing protein n=1 Tax=Synechococcus elongatus PCC 11802 TaxID=2283154 RepID=A0AAT9JP24_SYNEL|nr:hypothetical protein [Synechococcus elongatus]QFZ92558.1 hypothetical protein EKO22_09580 [Synechococcus elongatus PCC 11802]
MPRLDTSLESSGAEFLVLGNLLIEGIQTFKAYTNFPGYDLIATSPQHQTACRIQVKSRWATDFDGGFPIRNFDCDFVVLVALNRGYRYRRRVTAKDTGRKDPQFFICPIAVVQSAQLIDSHWGKVFLKQIDNIEHYENQWSLIRTFLESAHGSPSS